MKKLISASLSLALAVSMLAGCGEKKKDGIVSISIGNWKAQGQSGYEIQMENLQKFREAHPDIDIQPNTYSYDTKDFIARAAANQLPTAFDTWFTEISTISAQGYCADIRKPLEKLGLMDIINPVLLEVVQGENGEIWGLPHNAYAQGLHIDKKLFKEAGLANDDGSIKAPKTWDEAAEYAGIIKEKTGKAGFVFPTQDNCGGWHFMNVAWSFGTEFMKQDENGKWKATFDSPEFKAALKWLYDLKWKYNALPEDTFISNDKRYQLFGTYQAGMMISGAPESQLVSKYDMKVEDIACYSLPAGPKGSFAQTGGAIWMFSKNSSEEEIEAALKWFVEYGGFETEVTDETTATTEKNIQQTLSDGNIILNRQSALPTFVNRSGEEKLLALYEKYKNIEDRDYDDYFGFENVTLRSEEPVCCQQLYAVLDKVIQQIITNQNVDIDEVAKKAAEDFQKNHLDNM